MLLWQWQEVQEVLWLINDTRFLKAMLSERAWLFFYEIFQTLYFLVTESIKYKV